jgi:hypothetical protein
MKHLTILFLMISVVAFSSCKKDEEKVKTLSDVVKGQTWNLTSRNYQFVASFGGFPANISATFSAFDNATITFDANGTYQESGKANVNTKIIIAGIPAGDETVEEPLDDIGTYKVIGNTQIEMKSNSSDDDDMDLGAILFTVKSWSANKIELEAIGTATIDGETVNYNIKQTLSK